MLAGVGVANMQRSFPSLLLPFRTRISFNQLVSVLRFDKLLYACAGFRVYF